MSDQSWKDICRPGILHPQPTTFSNIRKGMVQCVGLGLRETKKGSRLNPVSLGFTYRSQVGRGVDL